MDCRSRNNTFLHTILFCWLMKNCIRQVKLLYMCLFCRINEQWTLIRLWSKYSIRIFPLAGNSFVFYSLLIFPAQFQAWSTTMNMFVSFYLPSIIIWIPNLEFVFFFVDSIPTHKIALFSFDLRCSTCFSLK